MGVRPQYVTSRSILPSPLKSPGVQFVGAIEDVIGNGDDLSVNGVNLSAAGAVGAYVTITLSVRGSTMHISSARPFPVRSASATELPTLEIQDRRW